MTGGESLLEKFKITLIRGINKSKFKQVATVKALGLRKIGGSVVHNDNPQTRGMIRRVSHLVKVENA